MLKTIKSIFFLGIKGVAMANLAVFCKKMGKNVYGADVNEEFITDELLKKNNIFWQIGFNNLPPKIDLIVYSAAHGGINNPLIIKAKKRNIKIISQPELITELMKEFQIKIAISGCHGKTTTSSLLSYTLNKLKQKPSYIVGTPFFTEYQGANFQEKKYFIVEADEYGINPPFDKTPKFFKLNPDWIICTNIDFDHPDVYRDINEVKQAFFKFFDNKKLILNIDDKNLFQFFERRKSKEKIITYGFSQKADYQILNLKTQIDGTEFEVKNLGKIKISLFGVHNVLNATAVICQLLKLGIDFQLIKKAILGFKGAKRRMEIIFNKDFMVIDDYAHHPNEIRATIEGLKERYHQRRIVLIFQPHTFSRTKKLLKEFKKSLSLSDLSFVLPIFPSARESKNDYKISSKDLVEGNNKIFYVNSINALLNKIKQILRKDDIVLTMGAGDVYKLGKKITTFKIN